MNRERVKVYTYKRVSTTMQIDGYSLDSESRISDSDIYRRTVIRRKDVCEGAAHQ